MTRATATTTRKLGFALTTALAAAALAGCAGKAAPSSASSAAAAEAAMAKGKGSKAIAHAEAAVLAAPRDGETRALLGATYLQAGRFASAASALGDAMQLGDTSGRTVLTYALALSAGERYAEAQTLLARYQRNLDPADYGLAITLAGSPQQGIEVLSEALRTGHNSAKLRQNLAYAFALKGDWRSARLVAAQDLPADKLDQRLGEWAAAAMPQMAAQRVAGLLGVTAVADAGQPVELALANFPTVEALAAEAAARDAAAPAESFAEAGSADAELPASAPVALAAADAPQDILPAGHAADPVEPAAQVAVTNVPAAPRITLPRPTPTRVAAAAPTARPVPAKPSPAFEAAFVRKPGAYRVQLGSYLSMADASDAWTRFQKRHPELKGAERVVTKATVKGRVYYRVAAGGFARESANSLCSLVKRSGGGCLAYAATRTLPGTSDSATRVATR